MILVGLTGGIGSGKSTVSALLEAKGAVIVDADAITRELQQPGTPVFQAMVDRFGEGIVADDGSLNRQAVADIVFNDKDALRDLGAIVHPEVGKEIARRISEAGEDQVVILDVPLLVESGRDDMVGIIVVDTPEDVAVERLVSQRGMPEADARARMANQVAREERRAKAAVVIDNAGSLDDLRKQVDDAWQWVLGTATAAEGR